MKRFPGFLASLLQPRAAWGLERVGGAVRPARRSSPPSRGRGACPVPGGDWGSGARCRSVPQLGEASPGFGPVRLKPVSHERRGSGNPGSGRGRARREGAAQSTYMRRGPADGCQEFPMKGDGGKFGQLGLANGEPREGSAPSPRPRPPLLPQRECVRLAHCAWRLGPRQAVRELQQLAAATAASSSYREQRRGGTGRRGASPAPPAQPSPARLPPHAGAGAAAATAAPREGGGRNPACSTRAPSWTIMIPSKPTTTCSPKRTGIETCSWTRPGRSSRERSAAAPALRSTPARPAPLAALPARNGFQARTSGGGGCAAAARWGVGLQARAEAGEPLSQSPRTPEPERGEVGPPAGRSPWGPRFRPPGCSRTVPAWAGGGGRCLGGWG